MHESLAALGRDPVLAEPLLDRLFVVADLAQQLADRGGGLWVGGSDPTSSRILPEVTDMGEAARLPNAETKVMRRGGWVSAATGGLGALVVAHALSALFFGREPQLAGLNLTNVAVFGATGLMIRRTFVARERRIWLPLAVGMAFYSLGFLVRAALTLMHGHVATPSAADPFWLVLYPGAYVTIALLVRRRVDALDAGLWLDGIVAALATTALGAAFAFRPVFDAATGGSISVATKLAYPLGDIVLLALVGGAVVLTGGRPARTWLLLGGGLVVFGIGDVDYVNTRWTGSQVIHVAWAIGLLMLAAAAWEPPPAEAAAVPRGMRRLVLAVPSRRCRSGIARHRQRQDRRRCDCARGGDAALRARSHGARGRARGPARGHARAGSYGRPDTARQPPPARR